MIVLVVDDQTSVVSGIVFGVNWDNIGVTRVLKAYNAFEAKDIMLREQVDVLLCDIEMPVESGLDLFRWVKDREMVTECIFLTAHADFMYVKQAMQLDGFDYILQPARYKDIEQAVERAAEKVQSKQEVQMYYNYGKMHYHDKTLLIDALLKVWFIDRELSLNTVQNDFHKIGISFPKDGQLYLSLLSIINSAFGESGVEELLRSKSDELFAQYGQKVIMTQLSKRDYGLLIYPSKHFMIDKHGVERQLRLLIGECRSQLGCEMGAYAGGIASPEQVSICTAELEQMRSHNVSLRSEVYMTGEQHLPQQTVTLPDIRLWGQLMLSGGAAAVGEESTAFLEEQAAASMLTAQLLKQFYQEFIQMLYTVLEQMDQQLGDIFPEEGMLELALSPYSSITEMKQFLQTVTNYFVNLPQVREKNKNQVEQMIHYIRSNLNKDIRRTDIAESVFLNPSYISRLFRQETGKSLKEFITEEKINMAQALLRTTDLPISMVAMKVGYTNFSHFSQVYKKLIGKTPAEDRKK